MSSPTHGQDDASVPLVELNSLLGLLGGDSSDVGSFTQVDSTDMPQEYRQLLAHSKHMTLAVEAYHGCPVDVEVLQSRLEPGDAYFREILLRRSRDQAVVQYGIVRLQLNALAQPVRDEILSEKIPLGRVLIEHNVLREVELVDLWKIVVGSRLARLLSLPIHSIIYGRTAMIYFGNHPALELLEVVCV